MRKTLRALVNGNDTVILIDIVDELRLGLRVDELGQHRDHPFQ